MPYGILTDKVSTNLAQKRSDIFVRSNSLDCFLTNAQIVDQMNLNMAKVFELLRLDAVIEKQKQRIEGLPGPADKKELERFKAMTDRYDELLQELTRQPLTSQGSQPVPANALSVRVYTDSPDDTSFIRLSPSCSLLNREVVNRLNGGLAKDDEIARLRELGSKYEERIQGLYAGQSIDKQEIAKLQALSDQYAETIHKMMTGKQKWHVEDSTGDFRYLVYCGDKLDAGFNDLTKAEEHRDSQQPSQVIRWVSRDGPDSQVPNGVEIWSRRPSLRDSVFSGGTPTFIADSEIEMLGVPNVCGGECHRYGFADGVWTLLKLESEDKHP